MSFEIPLWMKADARQRRAMNESPGRDNSRSIACGTAISCMATSRLKGPARTAERAPERLVVGRRGRRCPCMGMAMDAAGVAAAAGSRESVFAFLITFRALGVAAEGAHRRPVRHC